MRIFFPVEADPEETRLALTPENVRKYVGLGADVVVQKGLGERAGVQDAAFTEAGASLTADPEAALADADMVLRVGKPPAAAAAAMKPGCICLGHLDPFRERELVESLAAAGATAFSIEMVPRTTVAQKMDALSSQANLAGYAAVILAADRIDRILPMMMTPAGTISPARVFVIGAGVAGLQAIATARRLGARVEAFDTRPVVEEQVASLGAKFVKVDLGGETGQTAQGYAKALTEEQMARQREAMAKHCADADIVITTAQLFGRAAPRIVTDAMLAGMKPGSVVVDLAVESGGNVEGSVPGRELLIHGVRVLGLRNMPGRVARHATQMYSNNLYHFVSHFWDKETAAFRLDLEDEIVRGALVTHGGKIVHPLLLDHYEKTTCTS